MRVLAAMMIMLGFVVWLRPCAAAEPTRDKPDDKKSSSPAEKGATTIWILSYERRDANPLADDKFLPKQVEPALAKLKDKGVKKLRFNFEEKQLAVWCEGKQELTLKDIQGAFGGLDLKLVAKAAFPDEP
jgi:hypothetical protein